MTIKEIGRGPLTGRTFGKVSVGWVSFKRYDDNALFYKCTCACGRVFVVKDEYLMSEKTQHCGLPKCQKGKP